MKLSSRSLPVLMTALLMLALAGCGKSPEQSIQDGRALLDKHDYKAAILELKSALQEQPNNREARLLLGKAHLASGAYADAEKELVKAREQGASNDEVVPALARTLLNQNENQKVLELALPAEVMNAQARAAVQVTRAEALLRLNKVEEARQAINLAEAADPKQPQLLFLKAKMAAGERNNAEAYRLTDAALAGDPRLIEAHYFKAALFEAEKKTEQAIQSYEKALTIDSKAYRAHLAISDLQFQRGQKEAGLKALKAAEAAAPNMPLVKYSRGIYELRQNNFKAANDALLEFLRVAPDYPPAQLASAMANLGLGNFEQSLKSAQSVLAKQPDNALAARVLAASQLKSGEAKGALATLTPLLKSHPQDPRLLALAGEAYYQNKDFQQALGSFRQAEALAPDNSEIRNRQAASLMALGQTDQALAQLEKTANLNDDVSRADLALVTINLQQKNFDKALQAIAALEKKIPVSAGTQNLRAIALIGKKDLAGARKSLEQAIALDAKFYPAVENLARLDLAEKKPDAAIKRFETLLSKNPDNLQAMLALAELALLNKREKDYVSWLEKAVKAHPQETQPRALLSRYYLSKNDNNRAMALAKEALKSHPDDPQALNLLGATQLASKDAKSGVETYKQLVQKTPKSADAHLRLGLAEAAANNLGAARDSLNTALKLKPDLVAAMDVLIRLEMQEKKPEAALQWAKKIQTSLPKSPLGFDREGDILISQQRYAPAAKAYQVSLDKGSGTQGLIKLHTALERSGDAKTGNSKLENWIKVHPNDLMARAYLAGQSIKAGQDKAAIAQYEEILRQRPSETMALNNLATLYQKSKDPRALEFAEKAYKSLPEHPVVQDTLGWILVEQGQTKRGLELLSKAVAQLDKNPTVQYHYAVALGRDGNAAKAKDMLQKLLAGNAKFPEREAAAQFLSGLK
jgi:putative PEP-CTERM system TPR-repeat lipoprotein